MTSYYLGVTLTYISWSRDFALYLLQYLTERHHIGHFANSGLDKVSVDNHSSFTSNVQESEWALLKVFFLYVVRLMYLFGRCKLWIRVLSKRSLILSLHRPLIIYLSSPLPSKRDIVTIFDRCMCVRPSRFVRTITCTIMQRFQNNMAQLLPLRKRSAI